MNSQWRNFGLEVDKQLEIILVAKKEAFDLIIEHACSQIEVRAVTETLSGHEK